MSKIVSIIIPTYKGHTTILLAVLSSLNQTYKNVEIIVVDDNGIGSEDQRITEEILKTYIIESGIKYIPHTKNKNGSAARNTGFVHSKGEYIAFLDDDDYMYPEKIEKQVALLESNSNRYGMVYCGGYYVRKDGTGYVRKPNSNGNVLVKYMTEKIYFNTSTILVKKSVVENLKGFDESFKRHQDWEFCARIMDSFPVIALSEPLIIKYRIARNEISDPDLTAIYAEHYLSKMHLIFNKLDKKNKFKILNYHYRRIAISYFFKKNVPMTLKYLKKTDNFFEQLVIMILHLSKHLFDRIFQGTQKRVLSLQEMLNTLKLEKE